MKKIYSEFYINEIDQAFAEMFTEAGSELNLSLNFDNNSGKVKVSMVSSLNEKLSNGIDFELSTSECCGLNSMELCDYLNRTVHTSSALEFFDFVFSYCTFVDFNLDFKENSWKIKVNYYK